MTPDLVVRSRRVVTPEGVRPAAVIVERGRIAGVAAFDDAPSAARFVDAAEFVVMPGVVDTHVHMNEPGRTDWEGFASGTRAAAAGGVTTIVDMPLNSVPATTNVDALERKRAAAAGKVAVDVAFWGGVVPGNARDIPALCAAGVRGFKCFLVPSGVDEFPAVTEADLREALPALAQHDVPLLVHAELPAPIERALAAMRTEDFRKHVVWMRSRPTEAETEAIRLLVRLAREFRARIHVVHVSTADGVELIRAARDKGLRITAETCPHYLTFASEPIPDGATEFKCAPPIRGAANREALWAALAAGHLDVVATDHSPCPAAMKCGASGDFLQAWGGIASLELGLAAVWTGLAARGGRIEQMADWMCAAPARLAGLSPRKGTVTAGADADIVVWDPDATFVVHPESLHQRHKLTPYAGMTLRGVVKTTFLRGGVAFDEGVVQDTRGQLL